MVKTQISYADWQKLEKALMDVRIGYEVVFDDHCGTAEMLIHIQNLSVYRRENKKEEATT